jgi:hypothetical protein
VQVQLFVPWRWHPIAEGAIRITATVHVVAATSVRQLFADVMDSNWAWALEVSWKIVNKDKARDFSISNTSNLIPLMEHYKISRKD